jgi:hypothetical protein
MSMELWWNGQRKMVLSATLSTTNPTTSGLGSNTELRGDRPVTNCLRHDMALKADGNVPYFRYLSLNYTRSHPSILQRC